MQRAARTAAGSRRAAGCALLASIARGSSILERPATRSPRSTLLKAALEENTAE